jgi:hypothetical protein
LDSQNSLLVDSQGRRIIGRFSPAMACDRGYWQRVIFPTAFGLISESLGITTLHCACVERGGSGLLLAGESGAGKSTLSLAMGRSGFAFLSDDWTYFSHVDQRTLAWGLITPVKLLPDTAQYFRELRNLEPGISLNGELAYEVDPEQVFGIQRALCCEPRWLIFLERQGKPGHEFVRMPPLEAAARLEFDLEDLPPEMFRVREAQRETIRALVERECWLLRHGEDPQAIARTLAQFCADSETL